MRRAFGLQRDRNRSPFTPVVGGQAQPLADPDASREILDQLAEQHGNLQRVTVDLRAAEADLDAFNSSHLSDEEISRRAEAARQAEIRRKQQDRRERFSRTLRLTVALMLLEQKRDELAAEIDREGSIPGLNPLLVELRQYQPNTTGLMLGAGTLAIARESQIRQLINTFDPSIFHGLDEHSALAEVNRLLAASEETQAA